MNLELENKMAFVSGSTSGIGLAIARRLLAEGASVIINGRSREKVDQAIGALRQEFSGVVVSGHIADFSKPEEVKALCEQLPAVDILINNVGIFEPKDFLEIPDEDWLHFFQVNVMSGMRLSRHILPGMLDRDWGRIIFISSESAVFIPDEMIHYGMTKTAQLAISRGLAELCKGTKVTVNSILPGPTRSEGVEQFLQELAQSQGMTLQEVEKDFFQSTRPTSLLQRFATVDEVANTVTYYCSPLAAATNGASIRVEGGIVKSIL